MSSNQHDSSTYDPPPATHATTVNRSHFFVPNGHPIYPPTHITFSDVLTATQHALRGLKQRRLFRTVLTGTQHALRGLKQRRLFRTILGQCINLIAAYVLCLPILDYLSFVDSHWSWNNAYATTWHFVHARTSPSHGHRQLRRGRLLALNVILLGLPLCFGIQPFNLDPRHAFNAPQSFVTYDVNKNQTTSSLIDLRNVLCDDFDDSEFFHLSPIDSTYDPTVNPRHSAFCSEIHSANVSTARDPKVSCATTSPPTTTSQTRVTNNMSTSLKRYKTSLNRTSSITDDTSHEPVSYTHLTLPTIYSV